MADKVKPAKPAFREKGAVVAGQVNMFSQWEMFEQVPDLQWPASVKMYTRMEREDSRVSSLLAAITLPIRRTQWRIEQGAASPEVTAHVAQNLGLPIVGAGDEPLSTRRRGRFSWPQHLMWALSVLQYGHSVFEQVYRTDTDGMIWLKTLAPRPQRTISQWNVAEDGGLVSIQQWAPAAGQPMSFTKDAGSPSEIPVGRLVVYTRDMEPGFWVGKSLLRPSYKHWLLKDELLRIQATTARRNGMGVPIATGAPGSTDADIEKLAKMAQGYRGGEHAGGALPNGADLKLLGVQGNMPDLGQAISYHDQMIAIAGLAHFLNLSQGGSYALASVQADMFVQAVQTFAESIADVFNQHVIEDLVDVNWGVDEPAPRLVFDAIGSQQDATAAALQVLVQAGILTPDVLIEQTMRQRMNLPSSPAAAALGGQVLPSGPEDDDGTVNLSRGRKIHAQKRKPAEQGALW
ncbi:DUF935 family protein [Tsukamurella sp. 1534]|uniref:phage portal protein family protein n=1 Tax=Tsukamurella sp. 1534 TaxID=1151061 RepID=UPI0002FB50E1|nr:DUF935 family protein [Tsukamurella sp. 1534]